MGYECSKCHKDKNVSEFSVDNNRARGHKSQCKLCNQTRVVTPAMREQRKQHSLLHKDELSAKARKWYAEHKEQAAETVKNYRTNNPEKRAAHEAVTNAIRRGELMQQPCEVCGCIHVHAHHEDYNKQLDVTWLCSVHHKALHAEVNHGAS